jgi:HK97 family phage portal protein
MAGIIDTVRGWIQPRPRNAVQPVGGGVVIDTPQKLDEVLRTGADTAAGVQVSPETAMRTATVYACVRIIAGTVATMPLHIKRRVSPQVREEADDEPVAQLLRRQPNDWQTPSTFRRMMQTHLCLRGNAYALIISSLGRPISLVPLHPDRMEVKQADDFTVTYAYTRRDGRRVELRQTEVLHLVGLTLDGVRGVSPITYAREQIGLSQAQDRHGAATFKNGARISHVLKHPAKLGKEGIENLRSSLDAFRSGGENEGKDLILEEAMEIAPMAMTMEDAQWIESRKLSRSDILMFYGVPPHMVGDTEKSTSWGSGIEQQSIGFVTYTLEDHLTTWEEAINQRLITAKRRDLYARFNRSSLIRADYKTRVAGYVQMVQWGLMSPDEVRALEDLNPRPDGLGSEFYDPPNTAGGGGGNVESGREPSEPA